MLVYQRVHSWFVVQPFVVTVDATKTRVSNMKRARSLACLGNVYLGSRESPQCQKLVCGCMWNECCIYVACFFHFGKWQKPQQTFTFARMAMQRTCFSNLDIELNRERVASNEQRMFCSPQLMGATPDHTDHVLVVRFWQPAGLRAFRKLQRGKGYCSWMLISYIILLITNYPWFFPWTFWGRPDRPLLPWELSSPPLHLKTYPNFDRRRTMAMGPKNGSQLTHKTILSSVIHSMQFWSIL